MVRLLILYGHPKDPEAFDKYYEEIHMPLARRMQGLKKWTIGKVLGAPDGGPSDYYYAADIYAESREGCMRRLSARRALESGPVPASLAPRSR